jgi:polar amino acid transport system substrate-binding protein
MLLNKLNLSNYLLTVLGVLFFTFPSIVNAAHFKFVTLVFPPLEFKSSSGDADGAAVEIVRRVMNDLGHTVEIKVYPWVRSLNMVQEGKADAIFTAYKNAERETFLDYSNKVLVDQVVSLYIKKGSPRTFNGDLKALKDFTIGTLNTVSYGKAFDEAKTSVPLKTQRVEVLDHSFKKLALGRIDYVVSNRYSADVVIKRLKIMNEVTELPHPVEVTPSYIGFSKKRGLTKLRDDFDKQLEKLKLTSVYDDVMKKYGVRVPKTLAKTLPKPKK